MADRPNIADDTPHARRARMWQSMRILRSFTIADLIATASVPAPTAYRYVTALKAGAYLECIEPYKAGRGEPRHATWKLIRDTGPYAPLGRAHKDPNLDPHRASTHVTIPRAEYERALRCVRACAGMVDPEAEVAALKLLSEETSS